MQKANSAEDIFLRLEAAGTMLRIDTERMPSMFHFATVSPDEVQLLRQIHDVIRRGRVISLHTDHMMLEQGRADIAPETLFLDCTGSAFNGQSVQPIFQGDKIVPQLVRAPLLTFSAAMAAYVEIHYPDDAHKNHLCTPVPFPRMLADYPRTMLTNLMNQFYSSQDKTLREWMLSSRLDGFGKLMASADKQDVAQQAVITRLKEHALAAIANLMRPAQSR